MDAHAEAQAGDVRAGLETHLRSLPPTAAPDAGPQPGSLLPSFDRGSVALVAADGSRFRLFWTRREPRQVPAGEYRLLNFVIEKGDWAISGTAPGGPTVRVRQGGETPLKIDDTIRLDFSATPAEGGYDFAIQLSGHGGVNLSLLDLRRTDIDKRPKPMVIVEGPGNYALGESTGEFG